MKQKVRMIPMVGVLAALCMATVLLSAGCQSENRVVAAGPSDTCPLCGHVTRIQPLTGLKYTTCVCPTCKKTYTMDEDFLLAIERFTGPNIGDRVHVCDSCGRVVEQCAACRAKASSQGG